MTTIDPGAGPRPPHLPQSLRDHGAGSPGETLRRLATGLVVRTVAGDSVEFGGEPALAGASPERLARARSSEGAGPVGKAEEQVRAVGALVEEIRALVVSASAAAEPDRPGLQAQIDAALASIDQIAASADFASLAFFGGRAGFEVTNESLRVRDYRIFEAKLAPGEKLDVNVQVVTSAQQAGLYLSFYYDQLNLATSDSQFIIEVGGVGGVREFAFASATSIAQIRDSINLFAAETGVHAVLVHDGGLRIESTLRHDSEFTSVRIIDDGGVARGPGTGFYRTSETAASEAAPESRIAFGDPQLAAGVTDVGQALVATVNGEAAAWDGEWLTVETAQLTAQLRIEPRGTGWRVNNYRALALEGAPPSPLGPGADHASATTLLGRIVPAQYDGENLHSLADIASGGQFNIADTVPTSAIGALAIANAAAKELEALIARIPPAGRAEAPDASTARDAAAEARRALLERAGGATGLTPSAEIVARALRQKP